MSRLVGRDTKPLYEDQEIGNKGFLGVKRVELI